ncbi:DNA-binding transcriptional MerR regulator [Actinopolyspora biskrensis]|uniref:DNA-binding transcriptional MerR regulator n=2 Tax=Actinopolyspora biskrensis TaxID=1470178 RepID=A0A852Z028_9ACTN|nr:DNA-binding transcriptional MerR regulator [Actinopolyspora biskrensis]
MPDGPGPTDRAADAFDDADYPAYTMGRASEILGVTPDFLRSLDNSTELLMPTRSGGGHRRYSRKQLRLAARVRELLDQKHTLLSAASRIAELERDLQETRARLAEFEEPPPER